MGKGMKRSKKSQEDKDALHEVPTEFSYKQFKGYFMKTGAKRGRKETDLEDYKDDKNTKIEEVEQKYEELDIEQKNVKEALKACDKDKEPEKFMKLDERRQQIVEDRRKLRN